MTPESKLEWSSEGFNYRAQGMRRVYFVVAEPVGINRFRPSIQRGAVSFVCNCVFESLEDAKVFCQADNDSIQSLIDGRIKALEVERDGAVRDAKAHLVALNAAGDFVSKELSPKLDQAHAALRTALVALELSFCHIPATYPAHPSTIAAQDAIAQIKACGIEGEM